MSTNFSIEDLLPKENDPFAEFEEILGKTESLPVSNPRKRLADEHNGLAAVAEDDFEVVKALGIPLKGAPQQANTKLTEEPWHRTFAYLLLGGATMKDAAKQLGKEYSVCNVVKSQGWFHALMSRLGDQLGQDAALKLIEGEAVSTVVRIVKLAETATSESVKLAANKELMERIFGKAVQSVEVKDSRKSKLPPEEERRQLEAELAELNAAMKAKGHGEAEDLLSVRTQPTEDNSLRY